MQGELKCCTRPTESSRFDLAAPPNCACCCKTPHSVYGSGPGSSDPSTISSHKLCSLHQLLPDLETPRLARAVQYSLMTKLRLARGVSGAAVAMRLPCPTAWFRHCGGGTPEAHFFSTFCASRSFPHPPCSFMTLLCLPPAGRDFRPDFHQIGPDAGGYRFNPARICREIDSNGKLAYRPSCRRSYRIRTSVAWSDVPANCWSNWFKICWLCCRPCW